MPGPFKAIAAQILKNKAPSQNELAIAGMLGGVAGSKAGNRLGAYIGDKRMPKELSEGLAAAAEDVALNKRIYPGEDNVYQQIMELAGKQGTVKNKLDRLLIYQSQRDSAEALKGQLGKHMGKYTGKGSFIGGVAGGIGIPMAMSSAHNIKVNALAKKLARGTAAAGAAGLGGYALYKRRKEKTSSIEKEAGAIGYGLKAIGAHLNPANVARSIKAGRQAAAVEAGTTLVNPLRTVPGLVDDVGKPVYEGTVGARMAELRGSEAASKQGLFFKRQPQVDAGMYYHDAGASQYLPVQPGQAFQPNIPMYRPGENGTFVEKFRTTAPTRLPKTLPTPPSAPPVAQGPIPTTTQAPVAVQPVQPTPPQGAVPNATGIANDAAEAAAKDEGGLKKWLDSIAASNPKANEIIKEWGPSILATAGPLVALYGEKAAMQMALRQTMEKAVPYAAGGLAVGAGFGMLSNNNKG